MQNGSIYNWLSRIKEGDAFMEFARTLVDMFLKLNIGQHVITTYIIPWTHPLTWNIVVRHRGSCLIWKNLTDSFIRSRCCRVFNRIRFKPLHQHEWQPTLDTNGYLVVVLITKIMPLTMQFKATADGTCNNSCTG